MPCSCRPVFGAYWYGLLLVGGLFMLLTIVLLVIAPIHAKYAHVQPKSSSRLGWYAEYISLVFVAIFFFVAWGFGIPATHPLHLGIVRVVFQGIFIVCNIFQGLVMVICFCLLSEKVRRACCRSRASYPITNNENAYAISMTGNGDGLLFENPIADEKATPPPDIDGVNFEFNAAATAKLSEAAEDVKEDLSKMKEVDQVSKL